MKPMLASPVDWDKVAWPKYISPKLDGIRCIVKDGVALSRSLKPIQNQHIQNCISHLHGLDGELIVDSPTAKDVYRVSNSGIMSRDGEPNFRFYVFDRWDLDRPWDRRFETLFAYEANEDFVHVVAHMRVHSRDSALEINEAYVSQGYEGSMLRCPNSPYKLGRATAKEGYLLKIKAWVDSDFRVTEMVERMSNQNEAKVNALGRTERSLAKAGLVPSGTMGTLIGVDVHSGVTVEVGTGFTDEDRAWFWERRNEIAALPLIKYKCMESTGGYDKPRHASYLGLRLDL